MPDAAMLCRIQPPSPRRHFFYFQVHADASPGRPRRQVPKPVRSPAGLPNFQVSCRLLDMQSPPRRHFEASADARVAVGSGSPPNPSECFWRRRLPKPISRSTLGACLLSCFGCRLGWVPCGACPSPSPCPGTLASMESPRCTMRRTTAIAESSDCGANAAAANAQDNSE
jgi:hypothetical protein